MEISNGKNNVAKEIRENKKKKNKKKNKKKKKKSREIGTEEEISRGLLRARING